MCNNVTTVRILSAFKQQFGFVVQLLQGMDYEHLMSDCQLHCSEL